MKHRPATLARTTQAPRPDQPRSGRHPRRFAVGATRSTRHSRPGAPVPVARRDAIRSFGQCHQSGLETGTISLRRDPPNRETRLDCRQVPLNCDPGYNTESTSVVGSRLDSLFRRRGSSARPTRWIGPTGARNLANLRRLISNVRPRRRGLPICRWRTTRVLSTGCASRSLHPLLRGTERQLPDRAGGVFRRKRGRAVWPVLGGMEAGRSSTCEMLFLSHQR